MSRFTVVRENWLTRRPHSGATEFMLVAVFVLTATNAAFHADVLGLHDLMPVSKEAFFNQHQFWRAWTALFAHADWGHLLSNLFLFVPLSYFLFGYFGPCFFPLAGFFVGGLVNMVTVLTMPPQVDLIGVSGVVYWMGAAWLTLYLLIERRESVRRRLFKVLIIAVGLFLPESYKPEVSYLAHFYGFLGGVVSSLAYYAMNRTTILAAIVTETIIEPDDDSPPIAEVDGRIEDDLDDDETWH